MKLTKQRLIEIIKEEYKLILSEKRIRMGDNEIQFHSSDKAMLIGYKGRLGLEKLDAKGLVYAIAKEFGIR